MLTEPQLRERVEELEEEVRQLRGQLHGRLAVPEDIGRVRRVLSVMPGEVFVLITLLECSPRVLSKQVLTDAYVHQAEHYWGRRMSEFIDLKQMNVRIHRLRRALRPHGVEIQTEWGVGYSLPKDGAARLQALLETDDATAG